MTEKAIEEAEPSARVYEVIFIRTIRSRLTVWAPNETEALRKAMNVDEDERVLADDRVEVKATIEDPDDEMLRAALQNAIDKGILDQPTAERVLEEAVESS